MHRRSHTHLGTRALRSRRRAFFTLAALPGLLALVAADAGVASAGGPPATQTVRAGVKAIGRASKPSGSGLMSVHSSAGTGVVETSPKVYLVFWGSQWSKNDRAAVALQGLFSNLYGSGDTWGPIVDQYCENVPSGSTTCNINGAIKIQPTAPVLHGVLFDNSAVPSKATTSQIAAEAVKAATSFGNTTPASNLNAQYVIASPSGTHPDGFPHGGFCAWHSSTSSSDGNIAYTNLPYVPDLGTGACTTVTSPQLLDGYESTETHEYAESVTDPFPSSGWLKGGSEIGDLCETLDAHLTLGSATYDVQGLWSNLTTSCVTSS